MRIILNNTHSSAIRPLQALILQLKAPDRVDPGQKARIFGFRETITSNYVTGFVRGRLRIAEELEYRS